MALVNPGFETGDFTGWNVSHKGSFSANDINNNPVNVYSGEYAARLYRNGGGDSFSEGAGMSMSSAVAIAGGRFTTASVMIKPVGADDQVGGSVLLAYFDESMGFIEQVYGNQVQIHQGQSYRVSTISDTAPANARYMKVGVAVYLVRAGSMVFVDQFSWNYVSNRTVTLTSPANGAVYVQGANVPFSVSIGGTSPAVTSVTYKRGATVIGTNPTSPYNYNSTTLPIGTHSITATLNLADGTTVVSAARSITIQAAPPPTTPREYKASNAYTYLVAGNFTGISSAIPSIARVTGVEVLIDYKIQALVRSLDIGISDPEASNPNVAFDITDGANIETTLLNGNGTSYTIEGAPISTRVELDQPDFTIIEEGTSDGKKWTWSETDEISATIGSEEEFFGLDPIVASDFTNRSLGFRFLPNLLPKPSYANTGDCCFRFMINKVRLRVYFDAGSAEYYFASPDKTKIIKGTLVASFVEDGNFKTADAEGVLQLAPELEVMLGSQTWIGDDWTIHAAYPPTAANQIGEVRERPEDDGIGMKYNALPTAEAILENRSRYEFISENFYGDKDLDSIYGAHGLPRAFAYNGTNFYKIYTQPDPVKDSPRHLAYHHGHLALGFEEGRIDISSVGQPYNFDGNLGATSIAIGDKIVGLLALSGTILGVFGSKSVWGISGTTVDNFATQIISPNIGAIEYTIADMGFPVYANAYGVYTLSQTQEYGDYLGTPLSQDVSPWLKPRLLRKYTSDKEVVLAFPVRAKNQYRIVFSDGYVMTMTLNSGQQSAPTFSFQKYTIEDEI